MNYDRLYKRAKNIIGEKTPLYKDCGLICSGACCKGDEGTGMLLFPHEKTSLRVTEKGGVRLAVCDGGCNRRERPLSCMIFPFFPYITKEGRVKTVPDIRGCRVCPLVENADKVRLDRGFLMRVKRVGRLLSADEECRRFLYETSREMDRVTSIIRTRPKA